MTRQNSDKARFKFQPVSVKERAGLIAHKAADAGPGGYFVLYQSQYRELPVIDLPQDKLVYRADNGRLISELQRLQKQKGLAPDHFSSKQDDARVQEELHKLLLKLSKDPQGPIYQELELQGMQTEPLLITSEGVVVNGNRRLAAMRDLLTRDNAKYSQFTQVRAAILPADAGIQEIEYVEAALQLAPETKLAYSWINRRLKLRRQKDDLRLPVGLIIESYRLKDTDELDKELQELALAESYLEDYCGRPGEYSIIEDADELFIPLNSTLEDPATPYRELWLLAGFAMIYARNEHKLKLGGYFPFAQAKPAYAPIHAMFDLSVEEGLLDPRQSEDQARISSKLQEDLAAVLSRKNEAGRLSRAIADILDQIRIDHHEKIAPQRLLQNIQQARKIAEKLEADTLNRKQRAELSSELAAIRHHSLRLLGEAENAPPPISHTKRKLRKLKEDPHSYFSDSKNPVLQKFKSLFKPRA